MEVETTEKPKAKPERVIVLALSPKAASVVHQILGFESREDVAQICETIMAEIDSQVAP